MNAFHTTPLCSPNRASILTGQYASRHGIIDNVGRDAMSHRLPNYHLELQRLGYETAHIGKWHMGNDASPRPGYDHWVAFRGQGKIVDPVLWEDGEERTGRGLRHRSSLAARRRLRETQSAKSLSRCSSRTRRCIRTCSRSRTAPSTSRRWRATCCRARHRDLYKGEIYPPRPSVRPLEEVLEQKPAWREVFERRSDPASRAVPRGAARRLAGGDPRARGDDGLGGRGRGRDPARARGNRPARRHLHRVPRRQRLFLRRARPGRRAPLSPTRRASAPRSSCACPAASAREARSPRWSSRSTSRPP